MKSQPAYAISSEQRCREPKNLSGGAAFGGIVSRVRVRTPTDMRIGSRSAGGGPPCLLKSARHCPMRPAESSFPSNVFCLDPEFDQTLCALAAQNGRSPFLLGQRYD